jgi:hypothetical protein
MKGEEILTIEGENMYLLLFFDRKEVECVCDYLMAQL